MLARLPGVGNITIFGARDYSMRIWLDPEKVLARPDGERSRQRHPRAKRPGGRGVFGSSPQAGGTVPIHARTQGRLTRKAVW